MKKILMYTGILALLAMFVLPVSSIAKISNGKELGDWWNNNAKLYDPLPEPLLCHIEASLSVSTSNNDTTSNDSRSESVSLTLRKNTLTSSSSYNNRIATMKQKMIDPFGNKSEIKIESKNQSIKQTFSHAFTKKLEAIIGGEWDYTRGEDKRKTYFGGAQYHAFNLPKLDIHLGGYYGIEYLKYAREKFGMAMQAAALEGKTSTLKDSDSDLLYLTEILRWNITDKLILSQDFTYQRSMENSDYYKWIGNIRLDIILNEYLSLFGSHNITHEENTATDLKVTERQSTYSSFGITFNF